MLLMWMFCKIGDARDARNQSESCISNRIFHYKPHPFLGTPIYGTLLRSESDSRTGFFPPEAPHLLPELSKCLRILPHHNDTGGPRISFIRQQH